MTLPISSAEPEKLFYYSDFGRQTDQELISESHRLSASLQHFEATCTEPGYGVSVSHLADALCSCGNESERVDLWVRDVAEAFRDADQRGVQGAEQVTTPHDAWQRAGQYPDSWQNLLQQEMNTIWHLGGILAPPSTIASAVLPPAGGASLVGLAPLTTLSGALSPARVFGESVWNWLHGYGWKTNVELVVPSQSRTVRVTSKSGFGALLDRAKPASAGRSKPGTVPESAPKTEPVPVSETSTIAPKSEAAPKDRWWMEVPAKSQQDLRLNGEPTKYGCTPTATSMILDYWHTKDATNRTMSAQDLLDANAKEGEFTRTGMSATKVHDEVRALGYQGVKDYVDSSPDTLREAVRKGPVLAIVKLGLMATGDNHAVVVTGISDDGQQVRINDPWDGQSHTYSWDQFSTSWGANFGKDAPKNSFVVIRPS